MNKLLAVLITGISLLPCIAQCASSAQVRMSCESIKFHTGSGSFNIAKLDFTTSDPNYTGNGEVAPIFEVGSYTHWSHFAMDDGTGYDPMLGTINLDTPYADSNNDGYEDFFDVSQSVSGSSWGIYAIPGIIQSAYVEIQWTRPAGSRTGTCVMDFDHMDTFTHVFEIYEYRGTLNYLPGSNVVTGTVELTQTGNPADQLKGPVSFRKSTSNPLNVLQLQAGAWTNVSGQSFDFHVDLYQRESEWPTNYYGWAGFINQNPATGTDTFLDWRVSIDDLNDADHDGIPDFSDNPPRIPSLALVRASSVLQLRISGDVGRNHELQTSFNLTDWQTASSFSLTNDPHTIDLPIASEKVKFWRVKGL